MTQAKPTQARKGWLYQLIVFLLLIALFSVIERQIQTWLGKQALAETRLPTQSYAEALEQSRQTGKPLLANFSAIWCAVCRRLDKQVLSNDRVRQHILNNYHYVRLEYEDEKDKPWFTRYGVTGFPALLRIHNASVERLPLVFEADTFLKNL